VPLTIDVTDVPEAESQPGAPVEILGPNLTTDDLAEHARTNAYEVMTALGRRYARVYLDAGLDAALDAELDAELDAGPDAGTAA